MYEYCIGVLVYALYDEYLMYVSKYACMYISGVCIGTTRHDCLEAVSVAYI